jgi:hypothetical protein
MIIYFLCFLFGIVRNKYYAVINNKIIELKITHKPDSIIINGDTYIVLSETSVTINKTMVYNWLKLEKIK